MKSSKLECVDERGQDSLITSVCMEDEEDEELDEFDPYLFIKNLPNLSSVVPTFRPVLLPKQTRSCPPISLVLDLDETLVHSTLEPCDEVDFTFPVNFNEEEHMVYVRCRPHLKEFMERVSRLFEIIIFTASQSIYAEQLLNVLDPKRKLFRHRVYRDSCVFFDGNYLKDLSVLGRDLSRVIIVDNSPQAFGFQVENGVPIESWFNDPSDKELLNLLPFLESLIGVEDVRPMLAKKFNLREKIDAAVAAPEYPAEAGDPFER
ncbi:CTD small phosphatase-like protein 2 isoform X2 [Capsella rubella]|nr:CTD small phosphatase-like protein 2 isoform X2 [Capsella rubella]